MYDFVAIDFETANSNLNSACSIGLTAVNNLKIVKEEYYLIKPPTDNFNYNNIQVHGITYDDVKDCEQFPSIWEKIKDYFDNVIIAHNAQFDMSVLKNTFDEYNIESPNFLYIDSIAVSNILCDCGRSLADRANYFNISMGEHHNALDDAITCANIVIHSIDNFGSKSLTDFLLSCNKDLTKEFYNLKANKTMKRTKNRNASYNFNHPKISDLVATTSEFDSNNPFYDKNIVLTGNLESLSRSEAMQKIVDVGGTLKSGVSRKVDYLIVGEQDKNLVGECGMSTKEVKAYDLIDKGYNITIINEEEFLEMIG